MLPNKRVSDKDLQRLVTQRLARTGLGTQTPIRATVHNGTVVVSGVLQFEYQRKPALKAVQGIEGVRNIVDQLKLQPPTTKWQHGLAGVEHHGLDQAGHHASAGTGQHGPHAVHHPPAAAHAPEAGHADQAPQ